MDKNLLQTAKAPMIALINPQAPKGRHDLNHGCNPWAETTPANHGCNPCAVTHRAKTLLLLLLLAMTTAAQAQTAFGGGSGTEPDPYLIYNTDQLDQLADDVNNGNTYENVWFKLMDDLDYTNKTYTPIGCVYFDGTVTVERRFCGGFWGNNHSINNVTINSQDSHCGLFGFVGYGGIIYELTLGGNSSIVSTGNAGGIAGEVWSDAYIINCHVGENVLISVHPVASGSAYAPGDLGGIAGYSSGKILGCVSKATINNGGIAKTENLGGIVGGLGSAGRVEYCRFLGTVIGTRHVGDVVGYSNGTITYNYYHTSVRHGGVDGNDTDGAKWMGTVTFGEQVSGSLLEATFWDGGTPYFGVGKAMWMENMSYNAPAGFVATSVTYSANGVALVEDGAYHRFTMPDADVTITGSATVKRDIGYSNWVTIDIPSQACTGDPLTPVVTVTDSKTDTPVTLVEGTHYTVTLPDGGCIDWGDYTITITGIGDFGGKTTAVFTITYPGGGSGTETDPYIIVTTDEMDALADAVNGGDVMNGKHFRLLADLNYSSKPYTPIGTMDSRFQGTFDGHGHSINNVVINQPDQDYQGLFAVIHVDGTVKNLVLGAGSSITGGYYVGGIAGFCSGTITGCTVSEGVSISGNQYVGGIAGYIVDTLSGCVNKASVSGTNYVGGIAGMSFYQPITNNLNLGAVSGNTYKGGIVGFSNNNNFCSNNYYAGACNVGGINGSDMEGKAMRGYTIEVKHPLIFSLEGSTGLLYDGKVYAGKNQSVVVALAIPNSTLMPQCFFINRGSISDNGDGTHTITMPNNPYGSSDVTVYGNIVESYGMYYEIPCDGSHTATVIYDDSYTTMDYVGIEDFEYMGAQYAVTAIADNVFDGLGNLIDVNCHTPQLATIGANAFRNCTGIMSFGFYHTDTPPTLGEGALDGLTLNTVRLTVPFCSQYEYSQHPTFGQFGEIFGNGSCEYNFTNQNGSGDRLWSNPLNWAEGVVPGEGMQVGIFGDCEIGADVTVGSVTINYYYDETYGLYERLTVKDGATLTATDFIYTTGDERNFIIEDGAQVIHPNAGAKATVQKNITGYVGEKDNYYLIGYSFAGSGAIDDMPTLTANEYDLYFYDEPTHYWINHKDTENNNQFVALESGKGYLYANSESQTIGLKGTLEAGNAMVTIDNLTYTAAGRLKGFNLVGNPFAHNVTTYTGTNVAEGCYVMNETKDDLTVSEISAANPLLPSEGFFVKATAENASITFNSRAKGETAKTGRINLELRENGLLIDRLIVKDGGEPLEKLTLRENGTKIYATEGAQDYAVVVIGRNAARHVSTTDLPVNFKTAKNGTYTLNVNLDGMDLDYLHLIDNMTGADIDLLTTLNPETLIAGEDPQSPTPSYTFTAKTTDYPSRFRLVFNANAASTGSAADAPFAYIDASGNIIVTADAGTASLQVVDMMGRVLVRRDASNASAISTTGIPAGMYVLRLIDGENVKTQKMVIQ